MILGLRCVVLADFLLCHIVFLVEALLFSAKLIVEIASLMDLANQTNKKRLGHMARCKCDCLYV